MRKIEKLDTGRFKVRFRYGVSERTGKPKQVSESFDTYEAAELFARWLDEGGPKYALRRLYQIEEQAAVPTLNEVAADFIRLRPNANEGTRLNYTRLWQRTWGPLIGHLPANFLTEDDLSRAVMRLGQRYSRKSLENQRGLLSGVVGRAAKLGYLPDNIARGMPLPDGKFADSDEMRILDPEEFASITARLSEHYRPFVRFLFATGCRWGEAVALQVQDVALPNVRIRRALKWSPDNNRVIGPPKTQRGNRTIAVTAEMHDEIRAACAGKAGTDLVWTAHRGGPILHRTFWSRYWLPAVRHLEPRPRIHDLRHSHASWLLAQGVPIHVVSRRLGHNSIQVTVDTYSHLLPDAQMMAAHAAGLAFTARKEIGG